jgi:hypothetical protein
MYNFSFPLIKGKARIAATQKIFVLAVPPPHFPRQDVFRGPDGWADETGERDDERDVSGFGRGSTVARTSQRSPSPRQRRLQGLPGGAVMSTLNPARVGWALSRW